MITLLLLLAVSAAPADLVRTIEQIAKDARGPVGVAAVVFEGGESVALRGDDRFPMQSVYKVPIAMAVLDHVERGELKIDQRVVLARRDYVPKAAHSPLRDKFPKGTTLTVGDLIRYALVESDGTASDVLLQLAGGPEGVMAYLRSRNLRDLVVATTEEEMTRGEKVQYRNWTTPNAAIRLLRALHDGKVLSAASRALILRFMTETPTGPRRIRGRLPAGTIVAHKTGTAGTANGLTRATNDIGIVTLPNGHHLAVAIFVSDSPATSAVREGVIARITRLLWDSWTRSRSR